VGEQNPEQAARLLAPDGQGLVGVDDSDRTEDAEFHGCSLPARPCKALVQPTARPPQALRRKVTASNPTIDKEKAMPFVNVKLIEGVFSQDQKAEMITKITEAMVDVEGEAMRPVTWVVLEEVNSGEWGIGGKGLTTQDVKDLQATGK
jgi:4-oxalocrotonate tautomerase